MNSPIIININNSCLNLNFEKNDLWLQINKFNGFSFNNVLFPTAVRKNNILFPTAVRKEK